ncbi:MAG: hypothetical protein Kow0042_09490 [Calditrichia bacterium]
MLHWISNSVWIKQIVVCLIAVLIFSPAPLLAAENEVTSEPAVSPNPQNNTNQKNLLLKAPENPIFRPGDAIQVSAFPDTGSFLNRIFPIDDRGFIELPIYGKVQISHMTEPELVDFLKEKFKDYLRFPYLQVKPLIRVSILGGVRQPGLYYFDPENSLWELLHLAGGTLDEDGLKKMKWQRDRKDVEDNLIPFLQKGSSFRTMGFRSGDQIWVRTPTKPGRLEKFFQTYSPVITFAVSMFSIYMTYYFLFRYGESRRFGGGL